MMMATRRAARTWRTCTILRNVGIQPIPSRIVTLAEPYTAKKEDNPEQALKEFRAIVDQEEEKGDWCVSLDCLARCEISIPPPRGFKALKQSTKLLFLVLRRPADALKTYTELLTYTKSAVTRNYAEKTINSILDYVGGGKSGPVEVNILERFYEATKAALAEARNDVSRFTHILLLSVLKRSRSEAISEDEPQAREAMA